MPTLIEKPENLNKYLVDWLITKISEKTEEYKRSYKKGAGPEWGKLTQMDEHFSHTILDSMKSW